MNNKKTNKITRLENKIYSAQKKSLGIKDINDLRRIRNKILSLQRQIDRLLDIPINYMPARPAPSAPMSKTMKVLCFFSISWFISAKL